MPKRAQTKNEWFVGIETGGTSTKWVAWNHATHQRAQGQAGPGNFSILQASGMRDRLREIHRALPAHPAHLALCVAGASNAAQRQAIEQISRQLWPRLSTLIVTEDTSSAFELCHGDGPGIMVICGTGSNVVGRRGDRQQKAAGWGHLFGDPGSAYDVARRGWSHAFATLDRTGRPGSLGRALLDAAGIPSLQEAVAVLYAQQGKAELARYAQVVWKLAAGGHRAARRITLEALTPLAQAVGHLSRRLRLDAPRVGMVGGVFTHHPYAAHLFRKLVREVCPGATFSHPKTPTVEGALRLAVRYATPHLTPKFQPLPPLVDLPSLELIRTLPTEQRNPRSRHLDRRSIPDLVKLFVEEESCIQAALRQAQPALIRAARLISERVRAGGRLIYVGAGTSGRLGVLDASEIPPTFGLEPGRVLGILAGGREAMFTAQEGAEDDTQAGAQVCRDLEVHAGDVVVGITASGRTPFVHGALQAAHRRKAATVFITCAPGVSIPQPAPQVRVDLPTGPEILTGSTRLKAGTATKCALNLLSTIAMIRSGLVHDNLMTHVQPTNSKLRARAVSLVMTLLHVDAAEAVDRLSRCGWSVRKALTSERIP